MDDSQSSDIFTETSGNLNYCSIDIEKYEALVSKIKVSAPSSVDKVCGTITIQDHFNVLLEDCNICIDQGLNLIVSLLEDTNTHLEKLCGYIEDAVCILQTLSNFIKAVFESINISVNTVKNFSTYTGNIILSVFTHCKDSECIYGSSLRTAEKQLKDLFKNCHELQLIYLMVLEKHLVFDLTEKEDQDILVKTLEINLKISDVVQSLDIKTMAEQWKSYTIICEKYSSFLLEKNIFNITSSILVTTIENNMKTAIEASEQDKIVVRSLKVANFSLKILLRICNTFKGSVNNNYEDVMKLLLHVSLCNSPYYEITESKSLEFSGLLSTHTLMPLELIVATLIKEEQFLKLIYKTVISVLTDTELLGYTLLVIIIMKALLDKDEIPNDKDKVISLVFPALPYCYKWFNIGLKFKRATLEGGTRYFGLYEYLLLHTVALSSTLSTEQYNILENCLYEALLGTEFYKAMFASNLWILLCRLNDQLHLEVLLGLIKVYQKLERHSLFLESPQQIHLSYTIDKLFETLNNEEKIQIHKTFSVKDEKNAGIWSALKLKNLPKNISKSIYTDIVDKLWHKFNEVLNGSEDRLDDLINNITLVSTFPFEDRNTRIDDFLLTAWLKLCPICSNIFEMHQLVWHKYTKALSKLTICYEEKIEQDLLAKILKIISNILLIGNNDIFHLLFKLFCKLSIAIKSKYNSAITLFMNTAKSLLEEFDDIQQYMFYAIISDNNIGKLFEPVLKDSKHLWNNFVEFQNKFNDIEEWHTQLDLDSNNEYIHKCIETDVQEIEFIQNDNIQELRKSNFDLGDINSLFEENDEEPVSKKAKLDISIDNLVGKIESDVDQLCQIKENILCDYKYRIQCVCDKLGNILT